MTGINKVQGEEYRFDNCVIRSDTRELLRDGIPQKIERRSFDLILYLIKLEGRVASKDELLEHVWGNHYVSDSVIAQSIMKVRKALGISGKEDGPIKTIHRVGYRFVGAIQRVAGAPAPLPPGGRPLGAASVVWLPTECASPKAGVSWVRYGLISVASLALEAQGVSVAADPSMGLRAAGLTRLKLDGAPAALLGDGAARLTGQTIAVDGGFTTVRPLVK